MAQDEVVSVVRAAKSFVEQVVKGLAQGLTINLREATPKDTGHAESNWIPSQTAPVESPAGSREAVSYAEQNQGLADLEAYKLERGIIFIVNNVHYILSLNEGSSSQAPSAFVQAEIQRAVQQ